MLTITPLSGTVGAEVAGIDLAVDLGDDEIGELREAFLDHHVLVFREQQLTPEQQMSFGRRFGELDTHPFVESNPAYAEVLEIVTEPEDRANFGGGWHTDLTFLDEPDLGSILYAVEVPPVGGDTLFANQHAAYDAMSVPIRQMLDGLVATHSAGPQYGAGGYSTRSKAMQTKDADLVDRVVEHPVVRTHPETGRKGLYVNPAFTTGIRGLRRDESQAMLDLLFRQAVKEPFTCRVRWEPGTLTMWDNRSVQHFALHDYAGHRRHMRRITIKGDRPV
ncbi:MAG: TauD/TfdA family dioxygenase [Acidimicrobiales bacterium]